MKKITLAILFIAFSSSLFGAPQYQTTTNACYKNREIMYPLQDTFDALKQTLMQSNLNIVTITKDDGIITAKGATINEDEETVIDVTLTVDFKEREEGTTSVKVIASYATSEMQNDSGQIGGAGISLPIPVPFTGKYTLVGRGNIEDPHWYRGFFSSLEKILFENYMKYHTKDVVIEKKEEIETPKTQMKDEVKKELETSSSIDENSTKKIEEVK